MHSQEPVAVLQLWGLAEPAARGPRARLTLDDIASAAVEIADRDGLDAVTLGAVARDLGLATTGLYRYVDSKETLVELMVDAALGPAPQVPDVDAWVDALWQRYAAHPWLATYPLRRAPRCPGAFAWLAILVAALDERGVEDPVGVAMAVDVVVRGYAGIAQVAAQSVLSEVMQVEIARRHPALVSGVSRPASTREELDAVLRRLLGDGTRRRSP